MDLQLQSNILVFFLNVSLSMFVSYFCDSEKSGFHYPWYIYILLSILISSVADLTVLVATSSSA